MGAKYLKTALHSGYTHNCYTHKKFKKQMVAKLKVLQLSCYENIKIKSTVVSRWNFQPFLILSAVVSAKMRQTFLLV